MPFYTKGDDPSMRDETITSRQSRVSHNLFSSRSILAAPFRAIHQPLSRVIKLLLDLI